MRLFLAIPLPPEALRRLESMVAALEGRDLKVVRPEGLHLTLVFLGEREAEEAEGIGRLLESPELDVPRIPASLGGYGRFPACGSPRVIFTPVCRGAREITTLQQALAGVLRRGGVRLQEEARGFTPHVTLARSRGGDPDLRGLENLLDFEELFAADRLVLYRSILKPAGSEYLALNTVMLK
ncbi:MAG: RNA 2',3'-cyclic phosphodiesterase [Thermoanaerobaculaceae bacterium]|nr:RNA 2',3'-cyclic phosphodiesterase [Thermoanaerobaculaceae bacterium]